ncbi:MAG: DUF512 domain-containing protein [Firmicutes bacterium]|nr:DUF512 domain-containing protein [Bacillota bacterium]
MKQVIKAVVPGGIGEELGFEPGDILLSIDSQPIEDVLDYYYFCEKEQLTLQILTRDNEEVECVVEKDEDEDLGLVFEEEFMGKYRRCSNQCIFCFIDQMPKGMRDSLYFKDDDARLSFLNGNYITMTNMSESDFEKIIRYQMSPINISVQAAEPDLRVRMLKNKRAAELMPRLRRLKEAGIQMNGQIVLCKGVNDKEHLDYTIRALMELMPEMTSVSIVPVGLSKFREGLYPLEPFSKEELAEIIDQVEPYREEAYQKSGLHFVHLSDEFYIGADKPLPEEDAYDGYLQLENGVGMMRLFVDEAEEAIKRLDPSKKIKGDFSLITGELPSEFIRQICQKIMDVYPELKIRVYVIINHFFGEHITVTGLLTGKDIIEQLKGKDLGERLLLPKGLLKADEDILLDDVSVKDIEKALQIPVSIVKSSGDSFVESILYG